MTTCSVDPEGEHRAIAVATEHLAALIEGLIELGVLVHDNMGTTQSQSALTHKTQQVVDQLLGLSQSPFSSEYPIPVDVISYIEDGRNPDIYTREFVEVTAKSNARLKGKMEGFAKLRDILGERLGQEFPHLKGAITGIKNRTSGTQNDDDDDDGNQR